MRSKFSGRILSAALALVMLLALLPAASLAADGDTGGTTTSGIELSKTATLEDDGTYTINLEAYATGTTTTTTVTSSVPLDIVLVIDQSGSMSDEISSVSSYSAATRTTFSYSNLQSTTYYYLDADGNYYKVSRGSQSTGNGQNRTTYYYLYYTDANGYTVYLSDTGTTNTQPTSVTNNSTTIYTGTLYTATTTSVTKLSALKTAATNFVSAISTNAAETGADHRIAIVGFASGNSSESNTAWQNTGLFIKGSLTNYNTVGGSATSSSLATENYQDALVSVNTNGSVTSSITTAISNFQASGGTYTSYGMEMANNVFANNSATYTKDDGTQGTRQRIVVVFTDGEPGKNGYDDDVAGAAVNQSYIAKNTYSATVYTVGLYASSDETTNVKNFMNYLSSNYPSAQYNTSNSSWSAGTQASSKYYMTTNDATELNNIFQSISTDVSSSSTTVTLDANAVMKDIMGDGFTLTDASAVSIKTVAGTSDGTTVTWGAETETSNSASYTISDDKTTVSVTGFNYAEKYISSGHEGEKICVTITGVLPTESVTTGEKVYTNDAASGIYADSTAETPAATFEQPQTIITKKLYVLDYAKTATLSDLDQNSVTGIVDTYKKVSSTDNALTQAYGTSALSSSTLTYTPTTMQWNGCDTFYVFGQTTNSEVLDYATNTNACEEGTANLWSKVSVIPANNVYYEDDFITTSTDGTTSTGTVGIVYTGEWTTVEGETSTSGNTETVNGSTYGWETTLADDTGDSDGSSHYSSTNGATATFTFTGTGVDIYSRTNLETGTVYAKLTGTDEEGNNVTKRLIVDDLAVSAADEYGNGTYYQIPTVSFNGLAYGTYTVTLTVTSQAEDRSTYYLDGIRVYNPLGTVTDDGSDAGDAYAADHELNAVFTEVRDLLIEANSFTDGYDGAGGVVFIDNNVTNDGETTNPDNTTSTIGTYVDYGPKNEVYLAAGQSIAFKVNDAYLADDVDAHFYLGLKSADGLGTKATVTNGTGTSELTISHSSDLYYEITPTSDGYIMVKNTGTNLLSITKLRATSATAVDTSEDVDVGESGIALLSADEVDEIMVYAASFDSLPTVDYTTEDTETDTGTGEGDVTIDNPTEDDSQQEQQEEQEENHHRSLFAGLIDAIRKWFQGRR